LWSSDRIADAVSDEPTPGADSDNHLSILKLFL
jgi:hypothetical protein